MKPTAIIIRLEGVFALSGAVYCKAMNDAFAEAGFNHQLAPEVFRLTFGEDISREAFLAYVSRHLYPRKQTSDLKTLFEVTYKRLRQLAREAFATATVSPGPGIVALTRAARQRGLGLVLVTALPPPAADHLLCAAGGSDARAQFDHVIKIDPADPAKAFAEASALFSGACLALEATAAGLAAAERANVPTVAVIGEAVLETGIHKARAVLEKLTDLADGTDEDARAGGAVLGEQLLSALMDIVALEPPKGAIKTVMELSVRDVLNDKGGAVKSVNPTDTVQFLAQRLLSERVGAMVVIGDTGALEGIVSERDLTRGLAIHGPSVLAMPLSRIMTRAVITCAPVDSIHNVAKVMTARRIRHLPVSDEGRLIGLISIGDVLNRRLEEVRDEATLLKTSAVPPQGAVQPKGF